MNRIIAVEIMKREILTINRSTDKEKYLNEKVEVMYMQNGQIYANYGAGGLVEIQAAMIVPGAL